MLLVSSDHNCCYIFFNSSVLVQTHSGTHCDIQTVIAADKEINLMFYFYTDIKVSNCCSGYSLAQHTHFDETDF